MKPLKLVGLAITLIFCSRPAFAAISITIGNGGHVVACHDTDGNVVVPQALDLYEGEVEHHYKYPRESEFLDPLKLALKLAAKVDAAVGPQTMSTVARVQYVATHMHRDPPGTDIPITGDSKETLSFPEACGLYQAINFHDDGKIEVDPDIWDTLSPVNKAALYLHEAVYWELRETGIERDSRRTRATVAYLMGGGTLQPVLELPAGVRDFQVCQSAHGEDRFYAYATGAGQIELQFVELDSHHMLTRTTMTGTVNGAVASLPLNARESAKRSFTAQAESAVDSQAKVKITWGAGTLTLAGTALPGSNFRHTITCEQGAAGKIP